MPPFLPAPRVAALAAHAFAPHTRRQVLRRVLCAARAPTDALMVTLRAALADPDWETRATAMLGAARLGVTALVAEVARCPLPAVTRLGPVTEDRAVLRAIRRAAVLCLTGLDRERACGEVSPKAAVVLELCAYLRCAAEEPPEALAMLVHALTEPLASLTEPSPADLPEGVERTSDGWVLRGTGIGLCEVPAGAFWVGGQSPHARLRRVDAPGFFLARTPLLEPDGTVALTTFDEAVFRCWELSQASGVRVRPPTSTEWEMAMRGTDARRFPWGNGHELLWNLLPSPHGLIGAFGLARQWVRAEHPSTMGAIDLPRTPWCTQPSARDERCALRPCVCSQPWVETFPACRIATPS